ncbi:conserved hypothetical protein [Ferroglobus placidus DSM 10642]|uniref:Uncharacterized protein n=1 Tax=Ferroglobus placidus (strain DSM 10642 / AEDII12DO) TaxID=589924 RepID=D3S239_FERPA|nr:ribbon-helix-helix domain-containing protein [Ferroglobus placidus]ADC66530.1 conserved hypothetical protein [Ferroglobus placidus DSM 10642]
MGTLTISISDEVEKKLRSFVKEKYGSSKGAMSKIIEEALKIYFSMLEKKKKVFRAYRGEELVAEARDLEELARILKEKNIDPRSVKIVSSEPIKPVARMGWK